MNIVIGLWFFHSDVENPPPEELSRFRSGKVGWPWIGRNLGDKCIIGSPATHSDNRQCFESSPEDSENPIRCPARKWRRQSHVARENGRYIREIGFLERIDLYVRKTFSRFTSPDTDIWWDRGGDVGFLPA